MIIAKHTVVGIHYELKNDAGETLDKSQVGEPLIYLHGAGGLIPGLEAELEGKAVGDELNVSVPPETGYSHQNDELIQEVPREAFQGIDDIQVGMQFQAGTQDGQQRVVTVTATTDDVITVDANHPLAGQALTFAIELVEIV